jgi:hypothetical protein
MGSPARASFQPKQVQDLVFGVPQPACDFFRLKRPVAGTKVAIQQFRDFFRCARLLDLVQCSKDVLVQAAVWICDVTQLQFAGLNVDLLEGAHLRLPYKFEVSRSRRTGWHELENQSADCVRLVFSGSTGKSIRPLESVWSQNFHFPILARTRTRNRDPPLSSLVAQRVFDVGDNLLCKLRIAEILQFDCDSHRTAILSLAASASLLQNVRALVSPRIEGAWAAV